MHLFLAQHSSKVLDQIIRRIAILARYHFVLLCGAGSKWGTRLSSSLKSCTAAVDPLSIVLTTGVRIVIVLYSFMLLLLILYRTKVVLKEM